MAGKEQCGVEFADANLFHGAAWLITPLPGQNVDDGLCGDFLEWVEKIGAKIAALEPQTVSSNGVSVNGSGKQAVQPPSGWKRAAREEARQ